MAIIKEYGISGIRSITKGNIFHPVIQLTKLYVKFGSGLRINLHFIPVGMHKLQTTVHPPLDSSTLLADIQTTITVIRIIVAGISFVGFGPHMISLIPFQQSGIYFPGDFASCKTGLKIVLVEKNVIIII